MLAYDGTDFRGWAEQRKAVTIQGTLKTCINRISGEHVDLRGASRTDSGAHAKGQVADFETGNPMPASKWAFVLNRMLPPSIQVVKSDEVIEKFHSRFYAVHRIYEYRISESQKLGPWKARFVHCEGNELNLKRMKSAAKLLEGKHDFRAFGEELAGVENAVRELYKVSVNRTEEEVRIKYKGTAFLRGMVRRMSGALVEIGKGKQSEEWIAEMLDPRKRDKRQWAKVLPACGLCLVKVDYGKEMRDLRNKNKELPEWE